MKRWIMGMCLAAWSVQAFAADTAARQEPPRLAPAWELSGPLVFVWPEYLSGRRNLIPFYVSVIQSLPAQVEVALASRQPPRTRWLDELGRNVRYVHLSFLQDIWLCDWAGIPATLPDGRLYMAGFELPIDWSDRRTAARARDDLAAGRQLGERLYGRTQDATLRMMPTQMTHNGRGVALVSNRVIAENEHLMLPAIQARLAAELGVEKVVFVPVPEGEEAGRIDGLVRFVAPDVLLIAASLDSESGQRQFTDELFAYVEGELGDAIRLIRVPLAVGVNWRSCFGNYLHLVQVGDQVLLPAFGHEQDERVRSLLAGALPKYRVYSVDMPDMLEEDRGSLGLNRIAVTF
jgi:agmatine/peptidylarginine deiminase